VGLQKGNLELKTPRNLAPSCRRVSCSTVTAKSSGIGNSDTSERCNLLQTLQCPSGVNRAGLLAPVKALVNANLSLLNGIVTGYPLPFYFLVGPAHRFLHDLPVGHRFFGLTVPHSAGSGPQTPLQNFGAVCRWHSSLVCNSLNLSSPTRGASFLWR
jgi:hypothetical protein